ncbi:TetR/AcrR family transcriptional regulator [Petroclostridium sp. X23]|uniref:TetR/AcrR family transcriptional regulator n=1 Tax=Petroclostridium sp. X23 TaxID=3045146 RepID=UPI0024AD6C41|nr:TetR/AcrR family transcriptional regulator [Petroclostridium sp. X23]WHH57442.1 TetR/AcrR family transcriptional regulator [Petroclostridium sp. X23]
MPRITKDPETRKNEILDAAQELFITQGFEQTAVSDIVKKVGVAQGTFYYYFKSKEEILKAVLERLIDQIVKSLTSVVYDQRLNAVQKMQGFIDGLFSFERGKESMMEYVHREQNAIVHNRLAASLIEKIIPLISQIVEEGVKEGVFDTDHPLESAEVLLFGVGYIHDSVAFSGDEEIYRQKMLATQDVVERVLGAEKGSIRLI